MNQQPGADDSPVVGYLRLRIALGAIGVVFPFALAIGKMLFDGAGIESSISAYYYTVMRDFWVGISFATAVIFMTYRGYGCDWIFGWIAAACAIGMALLPVAPELNFTRHEEVIGKIHNILGA